MHGGGSGADDSDGVCVWGGVGLGLMIRGGWIEEGHG